MATFQGFVIGGVVAGLNHVMHPRDDNGYEQNGKKINNKGGNKTDYLYRANGNEIASYFRLKISFTQEELGFLEGYGFRNNTIGTGGAMTDSSFDIVSFVTSLGEIKAGYTLLKMGLTSVPKS